MIHSTQHGVQNSGPWDPWQASDKLFLVYQPGLSGAEFRTLGPVAAGGGKQPTFRTARAQRMVTPSTAVAAAPQCVPTSTRGPPPKHARYLLFGVWGVPLTSRLHPLPSGSVPACA